jgi:hypothetical protein
MDDSRDPERERSTMAHVRPAWDDARMERNWSALMERVHGRRRRIPSLLAQLRFSRAAR